MQKHWYSKITSCDFFLNWKFNSKRMWRILKAMTEKPQNLSKEKIQRCFDKWKACRDYNAKGTILQKINISIIVHFSLGKHSFHLLKTVLNLMSESLIYLDFFFSAFKWRNNIFDWVNKKHIKTKIEKYTDRSGIWACWIRFGIWL